MVMSGAVDWKRLGWGSLLGGVIAGGIAVPRAARACHETPRDDARYNYAANVGVFIGMNFEPRIRFTYGIDVRVGTGAAVPFARVQGYGTSAVKFVAGVQGVTRNAAAESGLAVRRVRADRLGYTGFDDAVGAHLAFGLWHPISALMAQGTIPFFDPSGFDLGLGYFATTEVGTSILFCGGGRPLRDHENMVLPPLCGWAAPTDGGALAAYWAGAARLEHASIWSFYRIAAELAAVGAPRDLVRRAVLAAGDEARHAARCMQLAPGFMLRSLGPADATPRFHARSSEALLVLASEAWRDGCLGESRAACEAEDAATDARMSPAHDTQAVIARDEAVHAELSWAILSWIWSVGSNEVRAQIVELFIEEQVLPAGDNDPSGDHDWLAAHGKPHPERAAHSWIRATELAQERARRMPR